MKRLHLIRTRLIFRHEQVCITRRQPKQVISNIRILRASQRIELGAAVYIDHKNEVKKVENNRPSDIHVYKDDSE